MVRKHPLEPFDEVVGLRQQRPHHHAVVMEVASVEHAGLDLGEVVGRRVVVQHRNHERAVAGQAARRRMRAIVHARHRIAHALARGLAHVGFVVEHARHRLGRDPGHACHIFPGVPASTWFLRGRMVRRDYAFKRWAAQAGRPHRYAAIAAVCRCVCRSPLAPRMRLASTLVEHRVPFLHAVACDASNASTSPSTLTFSMVSPWRIVLTTFCRPHRPPRRTRCACRPATASAPG